jgi:integrase
MTNHNPENERLKHRYFAYLRGAKGHSEASVDQAAAALARFEASTRFKAFKAFHWKQADAFRARLAETPNATGRGVLSLATQRSILAAVKAFFEWLAAQPGFRSKLTHSDFAYFSMSRKDDAIARRTKERPFPTLEQVHHVIRTMPHTTPIERRDRALIATAILTGARDGALSSALLGHVDPVARTFLNDGATMRTKFAKTFTTTYCPIGGDAEAVLADWVAFLRREILFGDGDPLFPPTEVAVDKESGHFTASGFRRTVWQGAGPLRAIFKAAFEHAGLPYFNPHSFRRTLTQLGQRLCRSPEEMKAWSQNLGHSKIDTTMMSYGEVRADRQAEIINAMGAARERSLTPDAEAIAEAVARRLEADNFKARGLPNPTGR